MIELTEGQVKKAVAEHLQCLMDQGKLWFCRLNAGDFIERRGGSRRRIKGAGAGTADFIVIQGGTVQMYYKVISRGEPWPIAFVTFIECKSTKGKQEPDQVEFEEKITKLNCKYAIIRDADELQEVLDRE